MIEHAERFIPAFAESGADWISVHQEACPDLHRTSVIKSFVNKDGNPVKAGVVVNPATSLSALEEIINDADYILLMSVNPGFRGNYLFPVVQPRNAAARHA